MKTWTDVIGQRERKTHFQHILQQVHQERLSGKTILPHRKTRCLMPLNIRHFDEVKVI